MSLQESTTGKAMNKNKDHKAVMEKALYQMIYNYMVIFGFQETTKVMARLMGSAKDEIEQGPMV